MSGVSIGKRTEKTEANPEGWQEILQIPGDEVCVVCLGGDGTRNVRASNGNIKVFQEELSKAFGKKIPVYGVAYEFAKEDQNKARKMEYVRRRMIISSKEREKIAAMNKGENPDMAYIDELYKRIIEPRIAINHGSERVGAEQAAINLRKVTFMAHCHGAFAALKLEDIMAEKMTALGYSAKEQALIQKQMLVVAQAPACPLGMAKSTFISFLSANDADMPRPYNYLSVYVDKRMREDWAYTYAVMDNDEQGKKVNQPFDLRPCYLAGQMGDCFLIKQKYAYDKEEGPFLINGKEHGFVGRCDEELTVDGKLLQKLAFNAMLNGVENSLQQTEKLVPLPEAEKLTCRSEPEQKIVAMMRQNGEKLRKEVYQFGRNLVSQPKQK